MVAKLSLASQGVHKPGMGTRIFYFIIQPPSFRMEKIGFVPIFFAFGVNILRIKINPAIPFNRIEGDANPLEPVQIFDSLENAEIKEGLHVKDPLLPVFKDQKEGIVIPGNHFFNGKVHGGAPHCRGCILKGSSPFITRCQLAISSS
jgi:hypothetical protein